MKKLLLALAISLMLAPSAWATSYFMDPNGWDGNDGLSPSTAWQSPGNGRALNCGDTITAAPGTYSEWWFQPGKWGPVNCPSGNNVVWVICNTFDTCKISATTVSAVWIDHSYWGIQGFEATGSAAYSACFVASPSDSNPVNIHHIIFANNVANGCMGTGIGLTRHVLPDNTLVSVDYLSVIGNIAYNAAQGSELCFSGISIYDPIQLDWNAGTHIYIAGNFSWGNINPNPCNGGAPTDGEGIVLDTLDASQGLPFPYQANLFIDNNIAVSNGGPGIQVNNNNAGTAPFAWVSVRHNTLWGNNRHTVSQFPQPQLCGEYLLNNVVQVAAWDNLSVPGQTTGCGASPIYSFAVNDADGSSSVYWNWAYAAAGTDFISYGSPGFTFGGTNTTGKNPRLSNPSIPGAPNCASSADTPACASSIISAFAPRRRSAKAYGRQTPSLSNSTNPEDVNLYPQWMCGVTLPPGLVTPACSAQ